MKTYNLIIKSQRIFSISARGKNRLHLGKYTLDIDILRLASIILNVIKCLMYIDHLVLLLLTRTCRDP